MSLWLKAISLSVHLLATAVWVCGLGVMTLLSWPAFRQGQISENQWLTWQKRLIPWVNSSLLLLLISGFVQMTGDVNYQGFLVIDSIWAWSMLI